MCYILQGYLFFDNKIGRKARKCPKLKFTIQNGIVIQRLMSYGISLNIVF